MPHLFLCDSTGCTSTLTSGLSNSSKILLSLSSPTKCRPDARQARRDAPVEVDRSATTNPSLEHASISIWKKTSNFSRGPCYGSPVFVIETADIVFRNERYFIGSSTVPTRSGSGFKASGIGALSHTSSTTFLVFTRSAAEKHLVWCKRW
jgi:hypothetical protein